MDNRGRESIILGDFHNDQASRLIIKDQEVFIRKPRSAKTELMYKAFIDTLAENGFSFLPGTVDIIQEKEDEHDVKIIKHMQAESIEEVSNFYKRTGAMLFFLYIFSGSDFHFENIIANRDYPVIVDYESLLSGKEQGGSKSTYNNLIQSVLGTHFLPNWKKIDDKICEVSGLLGGPDKNILFFKGQPTYAYDFLDDIIEGFVYAFHFCDKNVHLIEEGISSFKDCRFRVIVRPTRTYLKVAKLLCSIPIEDRKEYAEALLSRAYRKNYGEGQIQKAAKLLGAEIDSVVKGEAPLFYVNGNGKDLFWRGNVVYQDYLLLSPVENSVAKLKSLTERIIEDQVNIIWQSVKAACPISKRKSIESDSRNLDIIIYNTLEAMSISFLPTGWIQLFADKGCPFIDAVGTGIYDGLLGILCCYAALYNKTSKKEYLETLLNRYQPYHIYGIPEHIDINSITLSLQEGISGHILALQHIYDLTGEDIFLIDSIRLIKLVTSEILKNGIPKGSTDILSGYASLAIAVSRFSSTEVIELALQLKSIIGIQDLNLTGFGHGLAGETLALAVIGNILKTHEFDEKIIRLLHQENSYYSEDLHNWRDLRSPDKKAAMMGWCSGAPGIGIAREKVKRFTDNAVIRQICEQDILRTKKHLLGLKKVKRDNLCCGNAARLMAASRLGIRLDSLYRDLEQRIRKKQIEVYHMIDTCDINMGLMQGYSGVGYALLMYGDNRSGDMII